jgi:uncharacterized damage-inducible protein DinB
MSLKENAIYSLNQARKMTESLIEKIESPSDWFAQPCDKANHPLWVVGHLSLADNMFAATMSGGEKSFPEGWSELFWFGSEVYSDASQYPNPDEVLKFFRDQREELLKVVDGLTDEFLAGPTPEDGMFADAPNMAQMLIFASFHEGIHFGQFTVAHRSLGHAPMFQPQPASQDS